MSDSIPESPGFDALSELLLPLGTINSPAELHGALCGRLCGGARPSEVEWLLEAVAFLDFAQAPEPQVRTALSQLFASTRQQLLGGSFELTLLLPGDDALLSERIRSLSQWCHGFLNGFGTAGVLPAEVQTEETEDMLRDLAAIVHLDADEIDEGGEADFMEVSEYVRMVAISLFLKYAGDADQADEPAAPPTVH